jgi:hypothetical protein
MESDLGQEPVFLKEVVAQRNVLYDQLFSRAGDVTRNILNEAIGGLELKSRREKNLGMLVEVGVRGKLIHRLEEYDGEARVVTEMSARDAEMRLEKERKSQDEQVALVKREIEELRRGHEFIVKKKNELIMTELEETRLAIAKAREEFMQVVEEAKTEIAN